MRCALKDRNLKVRALRRARELREASASLIFLALFLFCGTFDCYAANEYN